MVGYLTDKRKKINLARLCIVSQKQEIDDPII